MISLEALPEGHVAACSGQILGSGEAARETMAGVGVSRQQTEGESTMPRGAQFPPPPQLSKEELRRVQKSQKREKRKLEKKAKKEVHKRLGADLACL